jgi:hypothetical protein
MRFVAAKASNSAMPCRTWSFPSSPALYRAIRCRRNSSRSSVKIAAQALWNADLTPHAPVESMTPWAKDSGLTCGMGGAAAFNHAAAAPNRAVRMAGWGAASAKPRD